MIDYDVLKTEVQGNAALGLPALAGSGNDLGVAANLNSLTGAGTGIVFVSPMARDDFLLKLAPVYLQLPNMSGVVQQKWDRILGVIRAADVVEVAKPAVQNLLATAVADGVLTWPQASGVAARIGSRAEVLFGAGTVLSQNDISKALRGQ